MSIKSAQAKQQLRNSDGTFANENKNAGLPSNDMIQRASKLLAKSSATVDEPIIKPSVKSEGYMGSTAITGGKYDASRSPAENAKLMRADIKALQKNGQLPKDWKIGVRTSTGSASWRARFTIQLPEGESSTYVPTHAEYMAADSEDRIIGPEHRAGRGIIEAHGGSASSDEWDETARRINQKIQNNEQPTVEERNSKSPQRKETLPAGRRPVHVSEQQRHGRLLRHGRIRHRASRDRNQETRKQ